MKQHRHVFRQVQQQPQGVAIRLAKSSVFDLQVLMFGLVSCMIGAVLCFFVMTNIKVDEMAALVKRQEANTAKLIETIQYLRTWKGLVDDRFLEQEASIRRIEVVMRIPAQDRKSAAELYEKFGELK